ncbi:MAG: hypothetical protein ACI9K2_006634 [Myxococcota bacterium]|jgi:hypothetical protein
MSKAANRLAELWRCPEFRDTTMPETHEAIRQAGALVRHSGAEPMAALATCMDAALKRAFAATRPARPLEARGPATKPYAPPKIVWVTDIESGQVIGRCDALLCAARGATVAEMLRDMADSIEVAATASDSGRGQ